MKRYSSLAICERLGFRLLWLVGSTRLRFSRGTRTTPTLPPSGPGAAIYQTTVIRLPPNVAAGVAPALKRLREHGPQHYYYPADTMHVTVLTLGRFLPDGPDATDHLAELRSAIASYPSFDLSVCGLNVSPTTVFAQIIPHDRTLRALRRDLREIAKRSVPQIGDANIFGVVARDLLAHANVVRFSGRVTAEFLEELSRFRQAQFGRWTVREVEVVQTDKLLSREGTRIIERMPLATLEA